MLSLITKEEKFMVLHLYAWKYVLNKSKIYIKNEKYTKYIY